MENFFELCCLLWSCCNRESNMIKRICSKVFELELVMDLVCWLTHRILQVVAFSWLNVSAFHSAAVFLLSVSYQWTGLIYRRLMDLWSNIGNAMFFYSLFHFMDSIVLVQLVKKHGQFSVFSFLCSF